MGDSQFAKNILFLRKKRKITQAEMPDRLDIKATTWSNYENANSEPDFSTLIRISNFFGVTIDQLLKEDLSSVEVTSYLEHTENVGAGRGIGRVNSRGNYGFDDDQDGKKSVAAEPDPNKEWALFKILKGIDEKVDKLLITAEKKP